jgi:hypothetical protein
MNPVLTVLAVAALAVNAVDGAVKALDFETSGEIRALPSYRFDRLQTGITNIFASSGRQSFFFRMRPWRKGEDQWPLFVMRTPVRDWSGFDRLVIDVVNLDLGGDTLSLSVAGPGVGSFGGLKASRVLEPFGVGRWVVPLEKWPEKMSPTNVTTIGISVTRPGGCEAFIDNLTLLKPGEDMPRAPRYSRESLALLERRRTAYATEREDRIERLRSSLRRKECGGMLIGTATTMEHKRPEDTFELERADKLKVRLARNEYEGVQVFAVPDGIDLKGVKVEVSPLKLRRKGIGRFAKTVFFPTNGIKTYTVGYVKSVKSPRWYRLQDGKGNSMRAPTGWWPDPLLDFVRQADVKNGTVQGFWINVHAAETQPAGFYDGVVTVSAVNAKALKIPFEVRVNDFTLPKTAVIPTAISFHPPIIHTYDKISQARKKDPKDITNIWKIHADRWTDLAADHLISIDYLYPAVPPRFDQLVRLKEQGRLGYFNLGYWRHDDREGVTGSEDWKKRWFRRLDKSYAKAKELGILEHAYLYGADEIPKKDFDKVAIAAKCVKERYCGIPLLTTAYDSALGTKGSALSAIDWFCPLTDMYDLKVAEASRAAGHKVWWYVSNLPLTGWANVFVEKEPIETRLLMGAMAEKMKVDGFLFYSICSWKDNRKPITDGPYTAWDPVSYEDYHGCGSWIYCGPQGVPVPTIRLENYRDGLEDLAYVKLLKEKTGAEFPVPEDVMRSMTDFTLRPEPLMRWRESLADRLEGAR